MIRRDFSSSRWRRAAVITPGQGRGSYLVAVELQEGCGWLYVAASSLPRAKREARALLVVPLHWRHEDDGQLVGYYLRKLERLRQPRLFELAPVV